MKKLLRKSALIVLLCGMAAVSAAPGEEDTGKEKQNAYEKYAKAAENILSEIENGLYNLRGNADPKIIEKKIAADFKKINEETKAVDLSADETNKPPISLTLLRGSFGIYRCLAQVFTKAQASKSPDRITPYLHRLLNGYMEITKTALKNKEFITNKDCPLCEGKGIIKCYWCSGASGICPHCDGAGCVACDKTGICPVCLGGGKIPCLICVSISRSPDDITDDINFGKIPANETPAAVSQLGNAAWKHELVITPIEDGKWGCSLENSRQVMLSAAKELWKYFPDRKIPLIEVVPKGGPIVYPNIGEDQHARIILNTGDNLWAQMAYQFAHEFCHLLCNWSDQSAQMWFQETLCEMASRFTLSRMAETWQDSPPYPNWKDYAKALQVFLDDLQKNDRLPRDKTLAQWYRENHEALRVNSIDRPRNNVVAAELWKMMDAQPEHWETVTYYPRGKLKPDTFDEFLRVWQKNCPEKHKAFIAAIAKKFEITLTH